MYTGAGSSTHAGVRLRPRERLLGLAGVAHDRVPAQELADDARCGARVDVWADAPPRDSEPVGQSDAQQNATTWSVRFTVLLV